jgi:hypothetical protein
VKVQTFACGVCKRQREQVNHWFIVSRGKSIIITPWEDATPEEIESADDHLCGIAHLLQTVNRMCEAPGKTIEG